MPNLRPCPKGHTYHKTSDCPTCPICEAAKVKAAGGWLSTLGAPACRALKNNDLLTLKKLSKRSAEELLRLHGLGPSSLPRLRAALEAEGLSLRDDGTPAKATAKKPPAKRTPAKKTSGRAP